MRAPSSLYSKAAVPSCCSASRLSSTVCASMGFKGRNNRMVIRASPGRPSVSAALATARRSPDTISARRISPIGSSAACATASTISPSTAPWRNSRSTARCRNSCSSFVARAKSSPIRRARSVVEPAPLVCATRPSVASTSASGSSGAGAASGRMAACSAAGPRPMRPCRGSPERSATAVSMSSGSTRRRQAARYRILSERALVSRTLRDVVTMS